MMCRAAVLSLHRYSLWGSLYIHNISLPPSTMIAKVIFMAVNYVGGLIMRFPEILRLPEKLEVRDVMVKPMESALLIIDVQNDFANPSGRLYARGAEGVIQPIKRLLLSARRAGATVIYTQDWHVRDDPEFKIWGEHAVEGTWGAEIVEELKPADGEIRIRKPSYDAFYSTPLDHILRSRNIRTLILAGLLGNVCVLCTAIGGAMRGYKLVVPVDAIFTIQEFDNVASLRFMSAILKAELTTVDRLRFEVVESTL
jgi:nicotinamidase-related amidase